MSKFDGETIAAKRASDENWARTREEEDIGSKLNICNGVEEGERANIPKQLIDLKAPFAEGLRVDLWVAFPPFNAFSSRYRSSQLRT